MHKRIKRRDFFKQAGTAGLGIALADVTASKSEKLQKPLFETQPIEHLAAPPIETVRVGYVGIGDQGSDHLENLLRIEGVEIKAVCDIREERTLWAQQQCVEAGKPKPPNHFPP